ncbi:MAG: hypothetical protein AB7L09_00660 [Nitrospira sp.]
MQHLLDSRRFVTEAGLSRRPAYYSGRGAIRCDLNEVHLMKIYQQILDARFPGAAIEFIKLVASMQTLSATEFLQEFYRLEREGWIFKPGDAPTQWAIDGRMDDGSLQVSAMASIFQALSGPKRDETPSIKFGFLAMLSQAGPPQTSDVLDAMARIKVWQEAVDSLRTAVFSPRTVHQNDI